MGLRAQVGSNRPLKAIIALSLLFEEVDYN